MSFIEHFKGLNPEQKKAATHIDGPLLVLAGPGTGKTQLLSSRVAYILKETDTRGSEILCLTFTNKSALNMRERVLEITEGKARDVYIRTFHSFASDIMNMYPDKFWNNAGLVLAPDAVQLEIIQTILGRLPLDNPLALKFAGKFTVTKDVQQALKLTKEAGLTPAKLRSLIEANLLYIGTIEPGLVDATEPRLSFKQLDTLERVVHNLPKQNTDTLTAPLISLSTVLVESLDHALAHDRELGKTTHTSDWKRTWVQNIEGLRGMHKERERNGWWLELAGVYELYRDDLHKRGYYDYSDMLVEVISQLEAHPEMRSDIQERFQYVMIDEFQDTNAAQLRIAELVADHHTSEGKPNLMAVGDDDQSIFKFNGAELNNMLSFRRTYPSAKTIVLTDNYRSNQAVLDVSEKVIEQSTDRITHREPEITKHLVAKSEVPDGIIEHLAYPSVDDQLQTVADHVKKNYSAKNSIAVIARNHESLRRVAGQLLARDIPVHYEQQRNILEHPLVEQFCLLAQGLEAINQGDLDTLNAVLPKTLKHPMWKINHKTLWKLAIDNYREPNWLESLLSHKESELKLHGEMLMAMSHCTANEPLATCMEYVLGLRASEQGRSPIYDYYAKRRGIDNDYLHGLSAIQRLRSLVLEYSSSRNASLQDFASFIRLEIESGTVINDESPFVSGDHAVSLLTVHKAKGLEFDHVYIIDAVEKQWQPRKGGRKPPANLPLQPNGDDMDDYVRLMFVAITRAKQNVTVSSYKYDSNGSEVLPTPLIDQIIPPKVCDPPANRIEVLEQALTWPRLVTKDEKLLLQSRMESYSLSVTHLLNFLDVSEGGPQRFLTRNLLRLPEAKTANLAHGTAMHAALEQAQKLINAVAFDLNLIKRTYVSALEREHLPSIETTRYIIHGTELLEQLFTKKLLILKKGGAPEQNITDVFVGETRLSGKLDRINQYDNLLVVSDYKTGQPLHSFTTQNAAIALKAWRHRTQLTYYALLLQNSSRFDTQNKTITGQMIYLNADKVGDMTRAYTPTSEEVDRLSRLAQAIWTKIQNVDLPDTRKYSQDYSGVQKFEEDLLNGVA